MISNPETAPSEQAGKGTSTDPLRAGTGVGHRLYGSDLFWSALRERWRLIVGVFVVTVGTAVVLTLLQAPRYRASASLVVTPDPQIKDTTDFTRGLETLERRTIVATLASIPFTRETHGTAAKALGWSFEQLEPYDIRASVVTSTNVIKVEVEGPHAEHVAEIANAVAEVTATQGHETYPVYILRPLTKAVSADKPFLPQPSRNYTLAAMVGLFLGLTGALTVEYLRS